MDWIKRNLYFLIGSRVAVALMGLAGWYLYSQWQLNNDILGKLDEKYNELKRLNAQSPHPGHGKVDNIKAAKEQRQELRGYLQKARDFFQRCPPIPVPESGKLTPQEFNSALSRTVDELQREAARASVALPPKDSEDRTYSFSFAAERQKLAYAPGSLEPLSVQLGEVKSICAVLFEAKVNSLDDLRRERVSDDDLKGPQTDYLPDRSVTNELAVLTPYEVTFRCFSSELASVLAGFANSPCGLIVKTINVESAPAPAPSEQVTAAAPPTVQPYVVAPPPPRPPAAPSSAEAAFADRYGLRGRAAPRPAPAPVYAPPPMQVAAPASRGGLPLVLDEKLLKVTLALDAVKLLSAK